MSVVPMVRHYVEDKRVEESWVSSLLAGITLTIFCGVPHLLNALALFLVLGLVFGRTTLASVSGTILAALFGSLLIPASPWDELYTGSAVAHSWRRYFDFSFVCMTKFDTSEKYMFAQSPHGVIPIGPVLGGSVVDQIFPRMVVRSISASNMFRLPLYKHFMTWMGAQPATKENFLRILGEHSAGVVTGGLAEMYMCESDRERVLLSRSGFIRVALEAGANLVPVYHFGTTQTLDMVGKSLQSISRRTGISFLFHYGRFGLPLPYRIPLMMALGKPIPVTKMDPKDPRFDDEVKRLQGLFIIGMTEVYNTFRTMYGWGDKELSVE